MRRLDELYTDNPFYGIRRMTACLRQEGELVNHKRVQRLLRLMGLEALYPKPNLSKAAPNHRLYPYRLRGVEIERVDQVWSCDITYLPMAKGFVYLIAIMDWYSRYILAWEISVTMEVDFCLDALGRALQVSQPEIFNTDQGSQFTSLAFTSRLLEADITISMDGKGRCFDNIWIERFWRSLKWEDIYLKEYGSVEELLAGLKAYFDKYNQRRPHQSLNYRTPAAVYFEQLNKNKEKLNSTLIISDYDDFI
jgi:putative transposase